MKTYGEYLGDRIRYYRVKAEYGTQQRLADAMDIDRTRVSHWERGAEEPMGDLRKTLCRMLKVTELELFGIPDEIAKTNEEAGLLRLFRLPGEDRKLQDYILKTVGNILAHAGFDINPSGLSKKVEQ